MALTVETGAGVAGANSYVSLADAATYHSARANTTWTGTDAAKEAAILRAMAYVEALRWQGRKYAYTNPLEWPRADVVDRSGYAVDVDEVPAGVVAALCEAALLELVTPGCLLPALPRGGQVVRKKIGPMETEFAPGAAAETSYRTILAPLTGLVRGRGCVELVRG